MAKFKKSIIQLEKELAEQIEALRASSKAYDAGREFHWEAKRLAATAYILLHDGANRTKSLLGLLKMKSGMKMLSSCVVPPPINGGIVVSARSTLIVAMRVTESGAEYVPMLDNHPYADKFSWISFHEWWEEPIFHPLSKLKLSRKNIVFSLRNQDGGGHVDAANTDANYATFSRDGDPNVKFYKGVTTLGANPVPTGSGIENGVRATMRQIAWEIDQSMIKLGL